MEKIKNKHHLEILRELKKNLRKTTQANRDFEKRYIGTDKLSYSIKTADKERVLKAFLKKHKDISYREIVSLLNSLYRGKTSQEVTAAGKLLEFLPNFKKQMDIQLLNKWLDYTVGWCEVDCLCQSNFEAELILSHWFDWQKLLQKFVKDKNLHKRRASLVLLVRAVRESGDKKLSNFAFENIDKLKAEKEILITKAISWLLRSLIKYHKKEVSDYLKKNRDSLPKIAVRETEKKIKTGKK